MLRYTSKHGTTFQFDPDHVDHCLYITSPGATDDADSMPIHFDDVCEFIQYVEGLAGQNDAPQDADCAAVSQD